ncbi:MAG: transporter substrate-binding domain-containing protein [Candidatus Cohnella colombiensis]|uniref:Circadian input-output histidine kinase CikA n=1 Tax=Candidatus Cohnella colombiensis TaxID=3121368 RepID=A0AA95EY30_9BACL|nr:MAG: transporter substrate-binding domain-containing protein [Cohnella sp.]
MYIRSAIIAWISLLLFGTMPVHANSPKVELTEAEQSFIVAHPTIYLGVDPKFVPFEFIDSDGIYKGITPDFIELIEQRTGLNLVQVEGLTWKEAYDRAINNEIDVLPSVSKSSAREEHFSFSIPYYTFQRVLVTRDDNDKVESFESLLGQKIAVQENSSHHNFLKSIGYSKISLYETVEGALAAVTNGSEQAFIGNLATSTYLIREYGFTHLKVVTMNSPGDQQLYFAIRKDWPLLLSIINKGLASITEQERLEIQGRWIKIDSKVDYSELFEVIAIAVAFIVLMTLVSWYWIRKLKNEVRERKSAEQALVFAKEEAEIANEEKSTFLARMSHEIRTPLNAITGMIYLMKKTEISTTQKLYMDKIQQASKNMLAMINDVLDFSKIEADRIEIERTSFNLDTLLHHVMNIISFKIEEQNIEFIIDKEPSLPSAYYGDSKRIGQVFINLINNAIKFTPSGQVSVTIRKAADYGNQVILECSVKDSGIGMSEEQIRHLFEPFVQGDASINRRFGGTGLGLSIVKNLLDRMGGEVSVHSVLGEGSTFVVKLQLEVDRDQEANERQQRVEMFIHKIRVLVLEKNQIHANLLRQYLNAFNMSVEVILSEDVVVERLQNKATSNQAPYDLLIVDYDTPMNKGLQFIESIQQDDVIKVKPKTMLLFPLAREDLFDEIEQWKIDIGITKPIIPSTLYNGIVEIFKDNLLEESTANYGELGAPDRSSRSKFQLLIVEDNKTNQFIARTILEQAGFNVRLAENGAEGVAIFLEQRERINLILMDLHMPTMDGYEATRLIRKEDAKVPIIAMTADAIVGVKEKCLQAGVSDFVSKPFDPEQLINKLDEMIKPLEPESDHRAEVAVASQQEEPILDRSYGLMLLGNKEQLYKRIIKNYCEDNVNVGEMLLRSLDERDYHEAIQIAHKVKGSSGNIGANKMYKVASALQQALSDRDEERIYELAQRFVATFAELYREVEQYTADIGSEESE